MSNLLQQEAENITYESTSNQLSQASSIIFGTTSISVIVISLASGAFILLKLKLNIYMKIILGITVTCNLVSSALNATALGLVLSKGYFTPLTCRLIAYSVVPLLNTINMLNSISILRYLMSALASKTKILKPWQAWLFISIVAIGNYIYGDAVLAWQEYSNAGNAVSLCLNEHQGPNQRLGLFLMMVKIIIVCICGFACDVALFKFIKKRNRVDDGVKMIPWKSTTKEQRENDLYIPIRATILSSIFMLSSVLLVSLAMWLKIGSSGSDEIYHWSFTSCLLFTSCGAPLAMIFFTVKDQDNEKSKSSNAQPPNQLQFHERQEETGVELQTNRLHFHDENDDFENIEMDIVVH